LGTVVILEWFPSPSCTALYKEEIQMPLRLLLSKRLRFCAEVAGWLH